MKAVFEQLKEYSNCYGGNGNCKKCFGDFDCGGSCHNHAKMLINDILNKFVFCENCENYKLMTSSNQHFCDEYGGYVTENDYCSRYKPKKTDHPTEKGSVQK